MNLFTPYLTGVQVQCLILQGENPNAKNTYNGQTPLFIQTNNDAIIQLLKYGADTRILDDYYRQSFIFNKKVSKYLMMCGMYENGKLKKEWHKILYKHK